MSEKRALPILVDGYIAVIPFPMPEEDFDLLLATIQLWKRKLVAGAPEGAPRLACEQNKGDEAASLTANEITRQPMNTEHSESTHKI